MVNMLVGIDEVGRGETILADEVCLLYVFAVCHHTRVNDCTLFAFCPNYVCIFSERIECEAFD